MSAWTVYRPNEAAPWTQERVVHLHRRTAFGATWSEIQRDLADDPQVAVSRLLEGKTRLEGVPQDFDQLADIIGQAAADSGSPERLKAWWLYRCLFTPHPLQERMTLMWHSHFATSNLKVDDLKLMKWQNGTLREFAFAPFGQLLRDMVRDPALLNWLDAPQNRKGHPNENLSRELMELFTLGIGHYTEDDVKGAARALTGWTVRQGEFHDQLTAHDDGEKVILGRTGKWTGNDLTNILLDQAATARRLVWRITNEFFGEGVVDKPAIDELADGLRERDLDIRWAVETSLRSERFFSKANMRSRICDPVSFLIGPLRALECWHQLPSTLVLAEWVSRMGQDLFYPPNVGGWPGGRAWLSTRTIIARANCMAALLAGSLNTPAQPPDLDKLFARHCDKSLGEKESDFFCRLLRGREQVRSESQDRPILINLLIGPDTHLH